MEDRKTIKEWLRKCSEDTPASCKNGCPFYKPSSDCINGLMRAALELIEGGQQEADRWIPVTERLPEEDGEYLVTFESGYAEDYGLDPIGIAPFEVDCEGFGIWQERFHPVSLGSLGSEWVDIPVTAWRPLPEAFEVEEEGATLCRSVREPQTAGNRGFFQR